MNATLPSLAAYAETGLQLQSAQASNAQRIQAAKRTLSSVQASIQGVQDVYSATAIEASSSDSDMQNTKAPVATCLADTGKKNVSAAGKVLLGLVGGTLTRLRKAEGALSINDQRAQNAIAPVNSLIQELNSLAAESPELVNSLEQSAGWMAQGQQMHLYAQRNALWSATSASQGESRLATVGNALKIVASDKDKGKDVSGNMAAAKPTIDLAVNHVAAHSTYMADTLKLEAEAINAMSQAQGWLTYALSLLPPPALEPMDGTRLSMSDLQQTSLFLS